MSDIQHADLDRARQAVEAVPDPEMPVLTLRDLGVLRDVGVEADGTVVVTLTPTYSGCPALAEMRADVVRRLQVSGFPIVEVRTALDPPWTTDWITEEGRRKLAAHGIAPPGPARRRTSVPVSVPVPVPLVLLAPGLTVPCPRCRSLDTEETSHFSATPCKALWRCRACLEPFDHVKEF